MSIVANVKGTRYALIKEVMLDRLGWTLSPERGKAELIWTDRPLSQEAYRRLRSSQAVNAFPEVDLVCSTTNLCYTLAKLRRLFPEEFQFLPFSWPLPAQFDQLDAYLDSAEWVIAHVRGERARLGNSIQTFAKGQDCLVQKYVDRPLLINGFKFDLRVYVVIVKLKPLQAYIYKQGLVRFASEPYQPVSLLNCESAGIHLPKAAPNKYSQQLVIQDDVYTQVIGHKRPLSAVLSYLEQTGVNVRSLEQGIEAVISKTVVSLQPELLASYSALARHRPTCFQVLGFDFLVDSGQQPWLLGITPSPSFSSNTTVDLDVKKPLICSVLKLVRKPKPLRKNYEALLGFKRVQVTAELAEYMAKAKQLWKASISGINRPRSRMPALYPKIKTQMFRKPRQGAATLDYSLNAEIAMFMVKSNPNDIEDSAEPRAYSSGPRRKLFTAKRQLPRLRNAK